MATRSQALRELNIKRIDETVLYSRSKLLGKGAFGEVYLGFYEPRNLPIAVKVINIEKMNGMIEQDVLLHKLKEEIVNMQMVRSEHIVQFLSAKSSKRNIYIICEFCRGWNLDAFIKQRGYLTEPEAMTYFKEILVGFKHLTEKMIVHRDLKPANLLMDHFSIKIADLGFSKCTQGHEQMLESTVGSPQYMSPQIFNREKYSNKTDIWSLGVILYEMLYGKAPWNAQNIMELKQKVQNQKVAFPKLPFVTPSTTSLISKMLEVEEQKRIDWETLFSLHLQQPQLQQSPLQYLTKHLYIDTYLQLPKIAKQLIGESRVSEFLRCSTNSEQFFRRELKIDPSVDAHYSFYFIKRNQISYLFHLYTLLPPTYQPAYLPSLCMHTIAILNSLLKENSLIAPHPNNLPYDHFLTIILQTDRELINSLLPITAQPLPITTVLKGIFKQLHQECLQAQSHAMQVESEVICRSDISICLRMIHEYVQNRELFKIAGKGEKTILHRLSDWSCPVETQDYIAFRSGILTEAPYTPFLWIKDVLGLSK